MLQHHWPEILILVAALICLELALEESGSWSYGRVVAPLVVFAVLTVVFMGIRVFFSNSRTVPTSVLRGSDIWFASIFAACSSAAMVVTVTYLPTFPSTSRPSRTRAHSLPTSL